MPGTPSSVLLPASGNPPEPWFSNGVFQSLHGPVPRLQTPVPPLSVRVPRLPSRGRCDRGPVPQGAVPGSRDGTPVHAGIPRVRSQAVPVQSASVPVHRRSAPVSRSPGPGRSLPVRGRPAGVPVLRGSARVSGCDESLRSGSAPGIWRPAPGTRSSDPVRRGSGPVHDGPEPGKSLDGRIRINRFPLFLQAAWGRILDLPSGGRLLGRRPLGSGSGGRPGSAVNRLPAS